MTISVPTPVLPGRRNPALGWLRARPRLVFGGLAVALLLTARHLRPALAGGARYRVRRIKPAALRGDVRRRALHERKRGLREAGRSV